MPIVSAAIEAITPSCVAVRAVNHLAIKAIQLPNRVAMKVANAGRRRSEPTADIKGNKKDDILSSLAFR